jgi:hypothetical protein
MRLFVWNKRLPMHQLTTRTVLYLLPLTFIVALAACKKHGGGTTPKAAPPDIYVLGTSGDSLEYWKNGASVALSNPAGSATYVSAMAVENNSVYVSGGGNQAALQSFGELWTQVQSNPMQTAILQDTAGSTTDILTDAIFADGTGDVYVGGTVQYTTQSSVPYTTPTATYPVSGTIAAYWKNGQAVNLPGIGILVGGGGGTSSIHGDYVSGIFVSGSDVYVSGGSHQYQNEIAPTYQFAEIWKDGVSTNLTDGLIDSTVGGSVTSYPTTTGVFVSGSDVYVSGTLSGTQALYWKNGAPVLLSGNGSGAAAAESIFVNGSDVYAAGYVDSAAASFAVYWKNGVLNHLSTSPSSASSIVVLGDSVYVAGWQAANGTSYATVWANGQATQLGIGGRALTVVAVPKAAGE